ncbi:GAF domain-containing protein [Nitratireductor aquibiodomus]|uniref:GAF domain-containing protein n=1 Tax=Nitratireductor aquibiodomus TaxID=204799 RepID=UPI0019D3963A|nr:GAF domain-containing protein [Nitratireductor aquibiodomus]MBN7761572.1 GAF domain-containing protein [Nitratireductor aquibiodomus]
MVTAMREQADKVITQVRSNGAARSQLVASWHRCMLRHRLDPGVPTGLRRVCTDELSMARSSAQPWMDAFRQTLRHLQQVLAGQRICSLLTDAGGIVLDSVGYGVDKESCARLGLAPGFDWSERRNGTNGVGTCLVSERPVSIRYDEHFFLPAAPMACVAAPIFGPDGQVSGALNLSLLSRSAGDEFAKRALLLLVVSAAQDIERACFARAYPDCRIIVAGDRGKPGLSLLAVDGDDVVVGATRSARAAQGITALDLARGIPADDLLEEAAADDFARAEKSVLRRTLLRAQGNVTAAAGMLEISRATMKRKVGKHFAQVPRTAGHLASEPERRRPN